jgi:transcriptional pleiotropic regulator of transition state genes
MSKKGIIRNLDNLGRLVIPKEIRKSHNLNKNKPVLIKIKENHIEISHYNTGCVFCGSGIEENLKTFNDQYLCRNCLEKLQKLN